MSLLTPDSPARHGQARSPSRSSPRDAGRLLTAGGLLEGALLPLQVLPFDRWVTTIQKLVRAIAKSPRALALVGSLVVLIGGTLVVLWVVLRRLRGSGGASGSSSSQPGGGGATRSATGDSAAVSLDNVDEETFALAQEILDQEGRERSRATLLDTIEQVQALQTADASEFRLGLVSDAAEQRRADRNVVAPASFTLERTYLRRGDTYVRVLAPAQLPDTVTGGWLIPLLTRGFNVRLSLQFQPRDPATIRDTLQQRLTQLTTNLSRKHQKGRTDTHEEERDRQAIDRLLDRLSAGDTRLFDVGLYLEVYGDTEEELAEETRKVRTLLAERGAKVSPLEYQQLQAQDAVAPVAKPRQGGTTTELLEHQAAATLFTSVEPAVTDADGIFLGWDETNLPVLVDRFDLSSFTKIIVGKIGSGKTFAAKLALYERLLLDSAYRCVLFDPTGDSFCQLAEALGGQVVRFTGDTVINPLELRPVGDRIEDPLQNKLRSLTGIMATYFGRTGTPLSAEVEGLLQQLFELAYLMYGETSDQTTHDRVDPTMLDVLELVDALAAGEDLGEWITFNGDAADLSESEQRDLRGAITRIVGRFGDVHQEYAKDLQLSLEGFRPPGGPASNLTGRTSVDLSSRVIAFDMSAMQDSQTAPVMQFVMLDWAFYQSARDTRPIEVVFEEAHYLLDQPAARRVLALFTRHSRHFTAGLTLISQDVTDFMEDPDDEIHTPKTIFNNADIKQVFHLESVPDEATEYLDLSPSDISYIQGAAKGQQQGGTAHDAFSECLLIVSGVGRRQLRIQVPSFIQDVLSDPLTADAEIADRLGMEPGAQRETALGAQPAPATEARGDAGADAATTEGGADAAPGTASGAAPGTPTATDADAGAPAPGPEGPTGRPPSESQAAGEPGGEDRTGAAPAGEPAAEPAPADADTEMGPEPESEPGPETGPEEHRSAPAADPTANGCQPGADERPPAAGAGDDGAADDRSVSFADWSGTADPGEPTGDGQSPADGDAETTGDDVGAAGDATADAATATDPPPALADDAAADDPAGADPAGATGGGDGDGAAAGATASAPGDATAPSDGADASGDDGEPAAAGDGHGDGEPADDAAEASDTDTAEATGADTAEMSDTDSTVADADPSA